MRKSGWLAVIGLVLMVISACTKDEEARNTATEAKRIAQEAKSASNEALRIAREAKSSVSIRTKQTFKDLAEGTPDLAQGQDVYIRFCAFCHGAGVAAAPMIGVPSDWEERRAKGMAVLVENSINGIGHMPPRGGEPGLTDEAMRDAVAYILKSSE